MKVSSKPENKKSNFKTELVLIAIFVGAAFLINEESIDYLTGYVNVPSIVEKNCNRFIIHEDKNPNVAIECELRADYIRGMYDRDQVAFSIISTPDHFEAAMWAAKDAIKNEEILTPSYCYRHDFIGENGVITYEPSYFPEKESYLTCEYHHNLQY